jgi:hypothetical protein
MNSVSRFATASSALDLRFLLRRLHKSFAMAVAMGAIAHLAVVATDPFSAAEKRLTRPLSSRFIKRQPRLTKPLELRKTPVRARQMVRHVLQPTKARLDQVRATTDFSVDRLITSQLGGSGIRLKTGNDNAPSKIVSLHPGLIAHETRSVRKSENKIDLDLEMLDINSMDTGRYRAIVAQDAGDRQALKGFVRFASTVSAHGRMDGSVSDRGVGQGIKQVDALRDAINEYTGLRAKFVGSITYDDPRLLEFPIIFPQGSLNENEMQQIARYVTMGGFMLRRPSAQVEEALVKYGGYVRGRDFWSQRLPVDHPVFNAFFHFRDGNGSGSPMIGYFIRGRLYAAEPLQGWGSWSNGAAAGRNLQVAINVVVYALTQEGSMTVRLMNMIN